MNTTHSWPWIYSTASMLQLLIPHLNQPFDKKKVDLNLKELDKLATYFEKRLATNTYLVGERPTIADFLSVAIFATGFKAVLGNNFRTSHPHFTRWVNTVSQHEFFEGEFKDIKYIEEVPYPEN